MKKKISKKMVKAMAVVVAIVMASTLVSAALLNYFGKVQTTMTAKQSIVIGDGEYWYNWNQPIVRNIGDIVHCTDCCYKLWIKNQACVDALVSFDDAPEVEGISIKHYVFGDAQTIILTHKDPSEWIPYGETITLTFNTCGTTFDYSLDEIVTDYSLVYYIDQEDRFVNWGKVFVIGPANSDSVNIPSMPFAEDINYADGAKFWLIPTDTLEDPTPGKITQMNAWQPELYYFEMTLGIYIDCDGPVVCMPCYPLFATNILKAESTYCWISCYHVDFYIEPGVYTFETTVNATPI